MSYCRFENTTSDLHDCYEAIENEELNDLNDYEMSAIQDMLEVCKNIMTYEDYIEGVVRKWQERKDK